MSTNEALIERLRNEAQIHAQEARSANATIAEIYRIVTEGTGEPGRWNGAEPVRKCIEELRAALAAAPAADAVASVAAPRGWSHWEGRIKALMAEVGMPDNRSLLRAMSQLVNEVAQPQQATLPASEPTNQKLNNHVAVERAALQMVRNALTTDAAGGRTVRAEMLAELDAATSELATGAQPQADAAEPAQADPLADLRAAVAFVDQVRAAGKAGEETLANGVFRDSREWLERAARTAIAQPAPQALGADAGPVMVAPGVVRFPAKDVPAKECFDRDDDPKYPMYTCMACQEADYGPTRITHKAGCVVNAALRAAAPTTKGGAA